LTPHNLTFEQLATLLDTVFAPGPAEDALVILIDLPDDRLPDHDGWRDRRRIAGEWFALLHGNRARLPFREIVLAAYPHVGGDNNDLPETAVVATDMAEYEALPQGRTQPLASVLAAASVVLAVTEKSATAPLKLLARDYGFRGATLPGFSRVMLPVLALDWDAVSARVHEFSARLDDADGVEIRLAAEGRTYESFFDLRHRTAHASDGLMRTRGAVANLPSGEAYIVPYEGEREDDRAGQWASCRSSSTARSSSTGWRLTRQSRC
jgi:hypothetical protein